MKRSTIRHAIVALSLLTALVASGPAAATTAIVTGKAEVYKTPQEVIDTLEAGAKVTTGAVNGEWVEVSYRKAEAETDTQGWVNAAFLEEIPQGFDSRVSDHVIVHSQDPTNVSRFDLKMAEDLYRAISRSLVNAENEPPFESSSKLRVYLFNGQTFNAQAKKARQPDDSVAYSPALGQVYLDFSLRSASGPMKAVIVHEMARLVLRDYSLQPKGRPGAGGPLPLWLVEAFAVYHQFLAGYDTHNLLYVDDRPKLGSLVSTRRLPSHDDDRRAFLATAGTLGYMLLSHGTSEQFSQLVRIVQADGGRTRGDAMIYEFYGMTPASFRSEWSDYVEQLKEKYDIKSLEEEIEEEDDDGPFGGGLSPQPWPDTTRAAVGDVIDRFLSGTGSQGARHMIVERVLSTFFN